jgi:hypothetical protein
LNCDQCARLTLVMRHNSAEHRPPFRFCQCIVAWRIASLTRGDTQLSLRYALGDGRPSRPGGLTAPRSPVPSSQHASHKAVGRGAAGTATAGLSLQSPHQADRTARALTLGASRSATNRGVVSPLLPGGVPGGTCYRRPPGPLCNTHGLRLGGDGIPAGGFHSAAWAFGQWLRSWRHRGDPVVGSVPRCD